MTPIEFFSSIYLGDRWCKKIVIDGVSREVSLQIDRISRLRGGEWDYSTADDIADGFLIFQCVTSFSFTPPGLIPNDWIEIVSISKIGESENFTCEISLGSVCPESKLATEITFVVNAKDCCLADSKGMKIP